ncbi:MAG: alpha/beta hydrolase [Planctomycetota bacterium]
MAAAFGQQPSPESPAPESPASGAAQPQRVVLWPDGAPGALGDADKDRPHVRVHLRTSAVTLQDAADIKRPAIVVCPGGGYGHLARDHEGKQIAAWLGSIGVVAVVLDYRHRGKGYGHPRPLQDVQRALRLVRSRADAWRIDPARVGVIGFSAGGHLAASASVHHDAGQLEATDAIERQSSRPDFAVLCYPVIAFGQPFAHRGSQRNLLGKNAPPELVAKMSCERSVDERTPPTFLWHTSADRVVSPQNSVAYYMALQASKVPCELHIFEQGRHGIGLGRGLAAEAWPALCRRWLQVRGVLAETESR